MMAPKQWEIRNGKLFLIYSNAMQKVGHALYKLLLLFQAAFPIMKIRININSVTVKMIPASTVDSSDSWGSFILLFQESPW